jgi:hypothetical protein
MTMPQAVAVAGIWIGIGLVGLSGLGEAGVGGPICAFVLGLIIGIPTFQRIFGG